VDDKPNRVFAQPLTFGGVARLAICSFGLWAFWMTSLAVLSAVVAILFLHVAWVPVIVETIELLPETGVIQQQELRWDEGPVRVTKGKFLSVVIDPHETFEPGQTADLQVELGRKEIRFRSLFGYLPLPYPPGIILSVNRKELEPWWGAWRPALAVGIGVGVVISLWCVWSLLALIYLWPVLVVAFYADRRVTWKVAWRLAAASMLPGALFLNLAILAYAFHHLNVVQLIFAAVLHVLIGWIYVLVSPLSLPPSDGARVRLKNPFLAGKPRNRNPFAGNETDD
jgi:hypothetical protein